MYYAPSDLCIPADQCKARQLYRVNTRNFGPVAVFNPEKNSFIGVRRKFGQRFLDTEYHFHNEDYPTARPWEELAEALPSDIELRTIFPPACKNCEVSVEWEKGPFNDTAGKLHLGKWFHLAETACEAPSPVSKSNRALFEWLMAMEVKYAPPGWDQEKMK